MRHLIYEAVRSVYARLALPADLFKLGPFYVRKKVVLLWLLVFYFLVPWILIGLNYLFNCAVCSSSSARAHPSLDGLCTGTTLSQIDRLPWYLDLWNPDQQGLITAHPAQDWPLYIEWYMSANARLHNPTLAMSHQLSKMAHRYPGSAGNDLVNRLRDVEDLTEQLYPLLANASRICAMQKDAMNHRLITFVNILAAFLSRSKPEAMLGWVEFLFFPFWHCFSMLQRHTGSWLLPLSKLHRLFVQSEIRFQMTRLHDASVTSLDYIVDSFLPIQHGPNTLVLFDTLDSAIAALELYQHDLKKRMSQTGGWIASSWLGPHLTSSGTEYRKLCEDYERSKRTRARLEEIRHVINMIQSGSNTVRDALRFLRDTFMSMAPVDLAAEGVVALPRAFQEHLSRPNFSWIRQDWDSGTSPAANASVSFHFDLDRANQKDVSAIRSALKVVCNDGTNAQVAGGAIHMVCAIQQYASWFANFDDGLIDGTQRSWVMERMEAQRRYELEVGANHEHLADVAIKALEMHERGRQIPEHLG
ncbi:MAG: hypothetical protein Q9205_006358 [Flavoplaca limonia]